MIELLLFLAAMAAGAINSVAGGGTFITFPALLFAGVPPIAANATCTIAIWPGAISSAFAYRKELNLQRKNLALMFGISLLGGGLGALTLLATPSATFEFLIPWLLLAATLLFAFSPSLSRFTTHQKFPLLLSYALQFSIAFYGGYFGAGIGILMLALLALLGMTEIHEMNALKTFLGTAINGVAVLVFVVSGAVVWSYAAVMVIGAIIGGYLGAHYAKKLPKQRVRQLVITIAASLTAWFFVY
jgi:uncharacterized membrane protein YfcA